MHAAPSSPIEHLLRSGLRCPSPVKPIGSLHVRHIEEARAEAIESICQRSREKLPKPTLAAQAHVPAFPLMLEHPTNPSLHRTLPPALVRPLGQPNIIELQPDDFRHELAQTPEASALTCTTGAAHVEKHALL
jgi:hypothetical protein